MLLVWDLETGQPIQRFEKHHGFISACAYVPGTKHIVSGDSIGNVILWDTVTGDELRRFEGLLPSESANTISVRPDGHEIAVGAYYGRVIAWNVATGDKVIDRHDLHGRTAHDTIWAIGYLDENTLYAGNRTGTLIWQNTGTQRVGFITTGSTVLPGGRLVLGGYHDVLIIKTEDLSRVLLRGPNGRTNHSGPVLGLSASSSGDTLISVDDEGHVLAWDTISGQQRCDLNVEASFRAVAFDPTRPRFAVASGATVAVASANDCGVSQRLSVSRGRISQVAAGDSIFLGDSVGQVTEWSPRSLGMLRNERAHADEVSSLTALPGAKWISGGVDTFIMSSNPLRRIGNTQSLSNKIEALPDGISALAADDGGNVWHVPTNGGAMAVIFHQEEMPLRALAVRPGGREAIVGGPFNQIFRISLPSGTTIDRWTTRNKPHEGFVALAYDQKGQFFAQGGTLGSLLLRSADSGKVKHVIPGFDSAISALAFTSAHLWVGGADSRLSRWDLDDKEVSSHLSIHEGSPIWTLAVTLDQRYLVAALNDGRASVRALPNGDLVAHLIPMADGSWATIFADGRFVAGRGPNPAKDDAVPSLRFEDPDTRRVATLGDIALPMQFGDISVERDPEGPARVRATLFSPRGRPTVRLDDRWELRAITPSPTSLSTYEIEFLLDDPSASTHRLVATYQDGKPEVRELTLPPDLRTGTDNRRALLIGNEAYRDTRVSKATGALTDARALAGALGQTTSWKLAEGTSLTTARNLEAEPMKDAVRAFFNGAVKGETLLFYFAGHGMADRNEGYLLPIDYSPSNPDRRLSATELWGWINDSKATQILVVLDACRAGSFLFPESAGRRAEGNKKVSFLMASSAGRRSMGSAGGGSFTQALVGALGRAGSIDPTYGAVTVRKAYRYAYDQADDQEPRIFGSLGTLALAWPPDPSRPTVPTNAGVIDLPEVDAKIADPRQITFAAEPLGAGDERVLVLTVRFSRDTSFLRITLEPLGGKAGPLEYYDDRLSAKGGGKAGEKKVVNVPLRGMRPGKYRISVQPCGAGKTCGDEAAAVIEKTL